MRNTQKYQLTVTYTGDRVELLNFGSKTAFDEALNNLRRMQTVKSVQIGDKRLEK